MSVPRDAIDWWMEIDADIRAKNPEHYPDVARVDRDIGIVGRLRLGGPNATEVAGQAADEIEHLRKVLSAIQEAAEDGSADECYVMAKVALARTV